jgi:hypothetical protein
LAWLLQRGRDRLELGMLFVGIAYGLLHLAAVPTADGVAGVLAAVEEIGFARGDMR